MCDNNGGLVLTQPPDGFNTRVREVGFSAEVASSERECVSKKEKVDRKGKSYQVLEPRDSLAEL